MSMNNKQASAGGLLGGAIGAAGTGLLAHKLIKPRHMPSLAGGMRDPDTGATQTARVTPEQMARVLQLLTALGGGAIGAGLGHGMQKIVTAEEKQGGFTGAAIGGLGGAALGLHSANRIPVSNLPWVGGGFFHPGTLHANAGVMAPEQVKAYIALLSTIAGGLGGAGMGDGIQDMFSNKPQEEEPKLAGVMLPEKEDLPTIGRHLLGGAAVGGSTAALLALIHDIRLQRQLGREQNKLMNPETDENTIVMQLPPKAATDKQANDPPTFALSMLAGIGGATGGYALIRKLYQQQLLKDIKRKEEAARTAVMNEMMAPKTAQFSAADAGLGTAYLLALLGTGGSAYVTKKILDERFRAADREKYEPPKVNRIVFRSQPVDDPSELPEDEKVASAEDIDAVRTLFVLHMMKASDDFSVLDDTEVQKAAAETGLTKQAQIDLASMPEVMKAIAPLLQNEKFRRTLQRAYLADKHPMLSKLFGWALDLPIVRNIVDSMMYKRLGMTPPSAGGAEQNAGGTGYTGEDTGNGGATGSWDAPEGLPEQPSIQFDPTMSAPGPATAMPNPANANTAPVGAVSAPMADPTLPPPAPAAPAQPTGDFKWTPPGGSPTTMPSMFSAPTPPTPAPVAPPPPPVAPVPAPAAPNVAMAPKMPKPLAPSAPMVPGAPMGPKFAGLIPLPTTAGILNSTIGSLIAENADKPEVAPPAVEQATPEETAAKVNLSASDPQAQEFLSAKRARIRALLTELAAQRPAVA
jgi:hypothetical protein